MAFKDKLRDKPVLGTVIAVQERYTEDLGNQLAASMAFFLFLSIFPILLLALSIAGFVLANDPSAQRELIGTVGDAIPGSTGQFSDAMEAVVDNRGATGLIGLVAVLLSGMRIVDAATVTTSQVYRYEDDANVVLKKLRSVAVMAGLGALALLAMSASALAAAAGDAVTSAGVPEDLGTVLAWTGPVVGFALWIAFFAVAYRVLAAGDGPAWGDLWPGALLAAVGWTLLQAVGAVYVSNQAESWNALYGTLGGIIAVMLLFFLAGRLYIYGAELNVVRCRRRGRTLIGAHPAPDPDGPAPDREPAGRH